jgi:short-subunit dehydrogenase
MKSVWIVGASSGIGESLAIEYANKGFRVFISARSVEKLNTLANNYNRLIGEQSYSIPTPDITSKAGVLLVLPMDVTDEYSIGMAVHQIKLITNTLHKVIINAGTCEYIDDTHVDINLMRRVLETNLFGAVHISNYALPLLDHNEQPQLVFVSSSVTYQTLPRAHAYGGSKAALRYFAECLKVDVHKQGIDVRVVSPGFVKTPLTDKNDFDMPFMISSEDAAKRIVKGLSGSTFDIHFPKRFTLILKVFSWLPDVIKFNLLGKMNKAKKTPAIEKNEERQP